SDVSDETSPAVLVPVLVRLTVLRVLRNLTTDVVQEHLHLGQSLVPLGLRLDVRFGSRTGPVGLKRPQRRLHVTELALDVARAADEVGTRRVDGAEIHLVAVATH